MRSQAEINKMLTVKTLRSRVTCGRDPPEGQRNSKECPITNATAPE